MKEVTSNCEKEFLKCLIETGKRLDGRESEECRTASLVFGIDYGCCLATLGNTRVLAQVSCEITAPRSSRPSEGLLQVNVEFTAMASAPTRDSGGRWSSNDAHVQPSRQLERTLRDSRCIDLESLCILAGKKVWSLRVAVYILNHDGNVIECSSIAAIAAILHFRRPDVTVSGVDVYVHPEEERDPVPVTLLHWPFCCTFAIYEQGEKVISDPTELEERVSEGCVVISMNGHQEVCMLHLGGNTALSKDKLLLCTSRAYHRVKYLTQLVKEAVQKDKDKRSKGDPVGFATLLHTNHILVTRQAPRELNSKDAENELENISEIKNESQHIEPTVFQLIKGAVMLGEGGPSSWETMTGDDVQVLDHVEKKKAVSEVVDVSSSEEEDVVVMGSAENI